MDYDSAVGMHNPTTMEPAIQRDDTALGEDDTRREDEPGDWFVADFDEQCSRGGHDFGIETTIRADGAGGWECRKCVNTDAENEYFDLYEESRQAAS